MSESALFLIPAAVDQSRLPSSVLATVPTDLLAVLAEVTDPRSRRGVRHRCGAVLAVAVCAVLAGARSYTAIAEWGRDLTPLVRLRLGLGRRPASESTIRRVLQRLDGEHLDRLVCAWLAGQPGAASDLSGMPVIAVDGKSARGARGPDGRAVHLLAAFDTATGVVLAQRVVDGKTNEITAFGPLLDRIDLTGALVTADALHTQRGHVEYLLGRRAHFLLTVKANQPTLLGQLRALPWQQVPVADCTRDRGHGRVETRTVKLTEVAAGIGFPHTRTAVQIVRRTRRAGRAWHTETVHAITDLTVRQATPAVLADAQRAHWGIENRLHWVRDVTFAEDLSQIRSGAGPAVMATLRNLAISLHRLTGATNNAAASRETGRHPHRALHLITTTRMTR